MHQRDERKLGMAVISRWKKQGSFDFSAIEALVTEEFGFHERNGTPRFVEFGNALCRRGSPDEPDFSGIGGRFPRKSQITRIGKIKTARIYGKCLARLRFAV